MKKIFLIFSILFVFVYISTATDVTLLRVGEENSNYADASSKCIRSYLVLITDLSFTIDTTYSNCIGRTLVNQTINPTTVVYFVEFTVSANQESSCTVNFASQTSDPVPYSFGIVCQEMPIPVIKTIGILREYIPKEISIMNYSIAYVFMFSIENIPLLNSSLSITHHSNDTKWSTNLVKINYKTYQIEYLPIYSFSNSLYESTFIRTTVQFQNNYIHTFDNELKNPPSPLQLSNYVLSPADTTPTTTDYVLSSFDIIPQNISQTNFIFGLQLSTQIVYLLNVPVYGNETFRSYYFRMYFSITVDINLKWVHLHGNVLNDLVDGNLSMVKVPTIDPGPFDLIFTVNSPNPALDDSRILFFSMGNQFYTGRYYDSLYLNVEYTDVIAIDPYPNYLSDNCYGFIKGTYLDYVRAGEMILSKYYNKPSLLFGFMRTISNSQITDPFTGDNQAPEIINWNLIPVPGFPQYIMLRTTISDDFSGFCNLYPPSPSSSTQLLTSSDLISGDLKHGVYEKLFYNPFFNINEFYISDFASNSNTYGTKFIPTIPPIKNYPLSNPRIFSSQVYDFEITSIGWSHNDIDLSHHSYSVIFSFSLTSPDTEFSPSIEFDIYEYTYILDRRFYGSWNSTSNQYEILVILPMRMFSGVIRYKLNYYQAFSSHYLNLAFESSELRVYSADADMLGPEITDFTTLPSGNGWTFKIFDKLNGFKNGNLTITADGYQIDYVFDLNPDDSIYEVKFPLLDPCIQQNYTITSVFLFDKGGYFSDIINAFKNYNDHEILTIKLECPAPEGQPLPTLTSFEFSPPSIDVGSSDRKVMVKFTVSTTQPNPLLKLPYVYLTSAFSITKQQAMLQPDSTPELFKYSCQIEVPYGFGSPEKSVFSIYGLMDSNAQLQGFTSTKLKELGFSSILDTTAFSLDGSPYIESSGDITNLGGKLLIIGKSFGVDYQFTVTVDYNDGDIQSYTPSYQTTTVAVVDNIKPTKTPFNVTVSKQLGTNPKLKSNQYVVTPRIVPGFPGSYDSSSSQSSVSSSSSSSSKPSDSISSSSSESIPVNPSSPCKNDCGGVSQGYCGSSGCICYSPWTGIDCTSKVIIIPTPSINNTTPSTNISIPGDSNSEKGTFVGLISIVELRELNHNGGIVYRYPFREWLWSNISTPTEPIKYLYSTNIVNQLDQTTTIVNVSIQYFEKEETITFAGESLNMNQYSIKYSINITSYSFTNSLNQLELVMKVSLESKDNQGCSALESGNTTITNSEYVKLQVNDHSLYGRFIKRGIIDGRISSISNQILKNYDSSESIQFNNIQSFIGIGIRSYKRLVQLDPDFSVLLDQRSAESSDSPSICSDKKKKLSTPQLVGIIIGSVLFASVVIVAVSYYFYKRRVENKFKKNIQMKMKNIDK